MEITIRTGLFTVRNVNIKACHLGSNFVICSGMWGICIKTLCFTVLCTVPFNYGSAQAEKRWKKNVDTIFSVKDSLMNAEKLWKQTVVKFQKQGYLLATAKKITPTKFAIAKGPFFDSATLLPGTISGKDTIKLAVFNLGLIADAWISKNVNNGFPFATMQWEIVAQNEKEIALRAKAESGDFYLLDSVITGNTTFRYQFLKHTAGVRLWQAYNQSAMDLLVSRLNHVEGIRSEGIPKLFLYNQRLMAGVDARRTSKDQLALLLGLATNPDGKVMLTGEAAGKFYNMFGTGVFSAIEWRSFKARSQELKVRASIPYFLGLPFITRINLGIEKFDTLYSIFNRGLAFKFPTGKNTGILIGADFTDRVRIFADEETVKIYRRLPSNPSSKNRVFTLGVEHSTIAIGEMPKKGLQFKLNGGVGIRTYIKDARLAAITWTSASGRQENVFDSLERVNKLQSTQYRINYEIVWYQPLAKLLVLKLAMEGAEYYAPVIYFNELTRYGGIKNMRGFNEQTIFANSFHMFTTELRLLAGPSGFVAPFYNGAYFRNSSIVQTGSGLVHGIGLHSALQTKASVLNIVWALGKTKNQPFAFNNSKFHFGISSTF